MARRLLLLNGIAIFCVVLFHAAGWGFTAMFMWAHRYLPVISPNFEQAGSAWDIYFRLVEQFIVFSIPAFLFVSGCFIAIAYGRGSSKTDWKRLLHRVRNLLIPYLVWTTVIIIGQVLQGKQIQAVELVRIVLTGSVNPAYYFVPLLIQLYLLSPIIYHLARVAPIALLVASGLVVVVTGIVSVGLTLGTGFTLLPAVGGLLPKWFFPVRLFWFALGIVYILYLERISPILIRFRWLLLVAIGASFIIGFMEWEWFLKLSGQPWAPHRETLVDAVYSISVIFGLLAFSKIQVPLARPLMELGVQSYGIYLIHPLVMEYFSRGVYHLAPVLLSYQIFLQPGLIILGLAVPLVMMYLVRRSSARSLYPTLFG